MLEYIFTKNKNLILNLFKKIEFISIAEILISIILIEED
jgi:citrate lyase synthetase